MRTVVIRYRTPMRLWSVVSAHDRTVCATLTYVSRIGGRSRRARDGADVEGRHGLGSCGMADPWGTTGGSVMLAVSGASFRE